MTHEQTAGHSATHGGLRGHSIGAEYPLMVIGMGDGYAVQDMLSGDTYPTASTYGGALRKYDNSKRQAALYPKPPEELVFTYEHSEREPTPAPPPMLVKILDPTGRVLWSKLAVGAAHGFIAACEWLDDCHGRAGHTPTLRVPQYDIPYWRALQLTTEQWQATKLG